MVVALVAVEVAETETVIVRGIVLNLVDLMMAVVVITVGGFMV